MTKNVNDYGMTTTTANGIGSAIPTIVGQNIGANNIKRVDKTFHVTLKIASKPLT